MTTLDKKIEILAEMQEHYSNEPIWNDFFNYNNVSPKIARWINLGLVDVNEKSIMLIEESFLDLCSALKLKNDNSDWQSLQEMFKYSPIIEVE
jgi:hypothetical protein